MIYMLCQTGRFTNQEIAKLFGLIYSSVSRRVGIVKKQLRDDKVLKEELDRPNVLIKIRHHIFVNQVLIPYLQVVTITDCFFGRG